MCCLELLPALVCMHAILLGAAIPYFLAIYEHLRGSLHFQSHHSTPDAIDGDADAPVDYHRLTGFPR